MDTDTKPGAWNIGWGWLVAVPLVSAVIWAASRGINDTFGRETDLPKTALDILRERYVKGEIDKKEFDQKLQDILYIDE